ncbi:MAG: hypothetical protein HUU06_05900, partial [Planctomycetaceae bacterium]|nr:hypothetical protein [Planctomycetaceae bacterium]
MSGCGGACGCGGTCGGGSSGKAAKEGKKGEAAEAKPKCRCVCWCEDVPLATHLLVPADSVASRDSVVGGGIPAAPSLPVPTLTLVRERRPGFDEVVPRQRAVAADSPWTPTGYEEVLTWTGEPDPGPATDASVPGPGIHRSYSPADVLASRVSRTRHPTGSPAAGLGTADGASPSPFPVLLPGLPEARPYPVLSAAAPGAGRWDYRTLRPG